MNLIASMLAFVGYLCVQRRPLGQTYPCGRANRALPGEGITVPVDETEDADEESSSKGNPPGLGPATSLSSSASLNSGTGIVVAVGISAGGCPRAWLPSLAFAHFF